jgi:N-acetylglucosamine kinase
MDYYMGIDGGGSGLRIAILNAENIVVVETEGPSANPSSIGQIEAAQRVQTAMRDALKQASLHPNIIKGVGLGIAGASNAHSSDWLHMTASAVLPAAQIVGSSDVEIALVGAHGSRMGALLLAGTGSAAAGIDGDGELVQYGGWGYLIGDEGGGYWIGRQAMTTVAQAYDNQGPPTILMTRIPAHLGLRNPRDLIGWLYQRESVPVAEVASLVPVVMMAAGDGDGVARQIIEMAAHYLAHLARALLHRTGLTTDYLAFAGSIIANENRISKRLVELLELPRIPQTMYSPAVGAALLAVQRSKAEGRYAD